MVFNEVNKKDFTLDILVACEESQEVCKAFREKGHNAFSCDIMECSGNHPEWHIKDNVLPLLNGNCSFKTMDGKEHNIDGKWDMILAFPPCTHLAVSGAKHFEKKRADGRQRDGIEFFCQFLTADCDKISIENPIGIISGDYIKKWFPDLAQKYGLPIKPTQIIQPYEFGHHTKKSTCLWLKGLQKLTPTNIVEPKIITYKGGAKFGAGIGQVFDENGKAIPFHDPRTAKARSKTFSGVAKAMADTWG